MTVTDREDAEPVSHVFFVCATAGKEATEMIRAYLHLQSRGPFGFEATWMISAEYGSIVAA